MVTANDVTRNGNSIIILSAVFGSTTFLLLIAVIVLFVKLQKISHRLNQDGPTQPQDDLLARGYQTYKGPPVFPRAQSPQTPQMHRPNYGKGAPPPPRPYDNYY